MYFKSPFALSATCYLSQISLQHRWHISWMNADGAEEHFDGEALTPALCYSDMAKKIRELATVSHPKIREVPTDKI